MSKKHKIIAILYFLVMAFVLLKFDNVSTIARTNLEYVKCGTSGGIPKPVPQLTTIAFTLLLVATPLVLIAFSILTLIKTIASGNAEEISKAKGKLLKKIIITAIIYLVAFLVQFVVNRIATNTTDKNTFAKCMSCFLYYSADNCPIDNNGSGNGVTSSTTTPSDKHNNNGTGRNSNTSNKTNVSSAPLANTVLVGDSKTVGLCGGTTMNLYNGTPCRDYITISKVGMGYSWFNSEAVPAIDEKVKNNKYNIVIMMGTNDVGETVDTANSAVNNYAPTIKGKVSSDWSDDNIIFVSVTPVGPEIKGGMTISQSSIDQFNEKMKENIEAIGKSNVKYCDIVTGVDYQSGISADGVHYTSDGYNQVYNNLVNKCLK